MVNKMEVYVKYDVSGGISPHTLNLYNKVLKVISNLRGYDVKIVMDSLDEVSDDSIHRKIGLEIEELIIDIKSIHQYLHLNSIFSNTCDKILSLFNRLDENNIDEMLFHLNKLKLYMKGE